MNLRMLRAIASMSGMLGSNKKLERLERMNRERQMRPWKNVSLSKNQRKGKTFEEIETLKKEIWEKQKEAKNDR